MDEDHRGPHYEGFFMYGDQKPHCWSGPGTSADRLREMAEDGLRKKPAGTTTPWWTTNRPLTARRPVLAVVSGSGYSRAFIREICRLLDDGDVSRSG